MASSSLIASSLTEDSLTLTTIKGSFTITKEDILAHYQSESGNAATRKANTITWAKQQIQNSLGVDMVDINNMLMDIDSLSGKLTKLEVL